MRWNWERMVMVPAAVVVGSATATPAALLLTQEQALLVAFPNGESVERKSLFLKGESVREIENRAKSRLDSKLVNFYVGKNEAGISGVAFFSTHLVRTMPETIMTVLNPEGTVRLVEILAFYEPEDYRPPKKWLGLFAGKKLDDELRVKRGIRNVAGATLTTQAITEAVRRILATYEVAVKPDKQGRR